MSEALQTLEVGPDRLPVPAESRPRQVALARRMLTFDPEKDTFTDVLLEVGYSPTTARAMARRTLQAVGVIRAGEALEAQREGERDKARATYRKVGDKLHERIETMRDEVLVATWKTSADILASGVGSDETQREWNSANWYRRATRRLLERAFRLGQRLPDVVLSPRYPVESREK
jgi:hypothetical protein